MFKARAPSMVARRFVDPGTGPVSMLAAYLAPIEAMAESAGAPLPLFVVASGLLREALAGVRGHHDIGCVIEVLAARNGEPPRDQLKGITHDLDRTHASGQSAWHRLAGLARRRKDPPAWIKSFFADVDAMKMEVFLDHFPKDGKDGKDVAVPCVSILQREGTRSPSSAFHIDMAPVFA